MDLDEIRNKKHELLMDDFGWHDHAVIFLIERVEELETDLHLNISMLSKQTDLAREAETRAEKAEANLIKLRNAIERALFESDGNL